MDSQNDLPESSRFIQGENAGRPPSSSGTAAHPLGPLVCRMTAANPARARGIAAFVLGCCCGIIAVSVWLEPDPMGLGTHRQLGFAPCSLVMLTGYPCPTCGMTTAFAHAVRGRFISAFQAQPAGMLLALATIATGAAALVVIVSGKVWVVNWFRIRPQRLVIGIVLVVLAAWVYKIAAAAWQPS